MQPVATALATAVTMGLAVLASPSPAAAQMRIGFISTFTGPNAIISAEQLDGFNLAIKDDKLGETKVVVITGDDEQNPETGREVAERMITQDHVALMVGVAFSNVMETVAPTVLEHGLFLFGPNAGPDSLAGRLCNPNFFEIRDEDHETHEVMGQYATDHKIKSVYLLAPDYDGGREAFEGFKRFYKGEIVGETMTPLLPQKGKFDFGPALRKIRPTKPDAVYAFYPAGIGIAFMTQYAKAGLTDIPLLGSYDTMGNDVLTSVPTPVIGARASTIWSASLDNPANQAFVAAFKDRFNRLPSAYAAQGYDTARLIASALNATHGDLGDKAAFRRAVMKSDFGSVRGEFHLGTNHFPIQAYRLGEVEPGPDGVADLSPQGVLDADHADAYSNECRMETE